MWVGIGCVWKQRFAHHGKDSSYQPKEHLVEAVVWVELGVEGGGYLPAVAHGHWRAAQGNEGLDVGTEGFDARGADER